MTTKSTSALDPIYRRLREQFGLPKSYVTATVLPEWWDDAAAASPDGLAEAHILLSRHLGLDARSFGEQGELRPARNFKVKLKGARSADGQETVVAQRLAVQVARIAALGAVTPVRALPTDGVTMRDEILVERAAWVDFESLLDYCWSHGIVVVHVSNFPKGLKRMHGLAARVDGRPVIVLSWAKKHPAWLLFVLAHELGHLALGHVDEGSTLIDDVVDKESGDAEERAANDFALALLCGSSETRFSNHDRWLKADALAERAKTWGRERRIDPGHVVLNYANTMGQAFYAVASAALAHLPGPADGPDLARQRLARGLDWERLPAESSEFIMRMTKTTRQRQAEPAAAD